MSSVRVACLDSMPVLRKAQSVSATPPAPPVGSRRVTAAPASVTSALARRSISGRGALADHPQQCDVAGERDHFEADGGEDPARVGLERAAQRVAEGVQRAAGEDQHPDQRHREADRQRSAARKGAGVEGGQVELGWGVGGEHGCNEYPDRGLAFSGGIRWRVVRVAPPQARRAA